MALMPEEDEQYRSSNSSSTTTTSSSTTVVSPTSGHSYVLPVSGGTWSGGSFMPNTTNHRGRTHPGLDIYAAKGTTIQAPIGGTVMATGSGGIGGNWIQIRGDDGYVYYFAHMQYPTNLQQGQTVNAGMMIGQVGNTGSASSTSPHVHFTVKTPSGDVVDPRPIMNGAQPAAVTNYGDGGSTSSGGSEMGSTSGPVNIPSGGTLYEVDGEQFVMFTINGKDGASHPIFFKLDAGATYPGSPQTVSAQQWSNITNGATDGGSTEAFRGVEPGADWDEIMERTLMEMGIYGSDAMSDASVLAVIAEVIARPDMTPQEMQTRLEQTSWWKSQTEKQNAWNDKSPAQQELEIVDAAAQLVGIWFTYTGEVLSLSDYDSDGDGVITAEELKAGNPDLAKYAQQIASGEVTQTVVINTWVKDAAAENPDSPWSRTIREEEKAQGQHDMDIQAEAGAIQDLYQAYGIDISWDEALAMGERVAMNDLSMEEVELQVDEMATALYPNKPKGITTRSWAQPYTQTLMSVLELPDSDLKDPLLTSALQNGESLGEFRSRLKKDDRWLETKNAKDEFNNTLSGLGNQMGF